MDRARIEQRWKASRLGRALTHHRSLDLSTYTLATAAQMVLCAAPLLVAVSAILHKVHLGSIAEVLTDYLALDRQSRQEIRQLFAPNAHPTWGDLLIGLVVALFFATGLAATSQRVIERVWSVPKGDWTYMWRQVAWALTLVPLFAGAAWASAQTRGWQLPHAFEMVIEAASVGLAGGLFYWWTQYFLLAGRIHWRRLISAAAYIGVGIGGTEAAAQLLVPGQVTSEVDDYGLVGATFVMSAWALVLASVVVGGTLLGFVTDERIRHRSRSGG